MSRDKVSLHFRLCFTGTVFSSDYPISMPSCQYPIYDGVPLKALKTVNFYL